MIPHNAAELGDRDFAVVVGVEEREGLFSTVQLVRGQLKNSKKTLKHLKFGNLVTKKQQISLFCGYSLFWR